MAFSSEVVQVNDVGDPVPSYRLGWQDNQGGQVPCYLSRDFGISSAAVVLFSSDFQLNEVSSHSRGGFGTLRDDSGSGIAVAVDQDSGSWTLSIGLASSWAVYGSMTTVAGIPALTVGSWYRMEITTTRNSDNTITVTAAISVGSAQIASATATLAAPSGSHCGFYGTNNQLGGTSHMWVDNIHVQASGSTNYSPVNIATSYVYTFVNDLGQESAPSPASTTILRPDGVSVTVTTPTSVPSGISSDYGINTKRIYRAATGSTGTAFLFLAEIPLGTASYIDTLPDSSLGEVLPSDIWALPPSDMRGILALPNGVMAGFSKNQLCLSAQNHPHAWPVEYRLTVDTDVVSIGNIDTTVVITTQNFVYLAIGSDPAQYSMTKLEVPQACVAKRSLAYLTRIGVVFASPDGLMAVAGTGHIQNLTSPIFTREQWQALDPTTIRAVAHDDIYWFFTDTESFALDMKADGFGLIPVAFHATAMFADPLTDILYLVLDSDDEPSDVYLPLPSTEPVVNPQTILSFNTPAGSGHMVYRWRGKLNLLPNPTAFNYCQVKAADYTNLVLRLFNEDGMFFEQTITSSEPFTLPMLDEYEQTEIELVGTSRVRSVQITEDIRELT